MRYLYEYVLRLTPKEEAEYFVWGRLVHEVGELRKQDVEIGDAVAAVRKKVEEEIVKKLLGPKQIELLDHFLSVLPYVYTGYYIRWAKEDLRYEVLHTEHKFELKLPFTEGDIVHVIFKGKIDCILRDISCGMVLNGETKTAKATGDNFWQQKELDPQPIGYAYAAHESIGLNVKGCLYDIFKKPGIKQRQGESLEHFTERLGLTYASAEGREKYFERNKIYFDTDRVENYWVELVHVAHMIYHSWINGYWPKHHPGNRFGGCAYRSLCVNSGNDGICSDPQILEKFYVRSAEEFNPELM